MAQPPDLPNLRVPARTSVTAQTCKTAHEGDLKMNPTKTAARSRRPATPSLGSRLRDVMPIPAVGALALGAAVLAVVCALCEVVQRLTGWSV